MKKNKLFGLLMLSGALSVSALTSCDPSPLHSSVDCDCDSSNGSANPDPEPTIIEEGTYDPKTFIATGEYSYPNAWDPTKEYGVKVSLKLNSENWTISEATFSTRENQSQMTPTWTGAGNGGTFQQEAYKALNGKLDSLKGKSIFDLYIASASIDETTPSYAIPEELTFITGATQSNGRWAKAIHLALNAVTFTGAFPELKVDNTHLPEDVSSLTATTAEAKYASQWDPSSFYGSKVTVYTDDEKVIQYLTVEDVESGHNLTPNTPWGGENSMRIATQYVKSAQTLTTNLKGQKASDVLAVLEVLPDVLTGEGSQFDEIKPNIPTAFTIIAGATQTNARNAVATKLALHSLLNPAEQA